MERVNLISGSVHTLKSFEISSLKVLFVVGYNIFWQFEIFFQPCVQILFESKFWQRKIQVRIQKINKKLIRNSKNNQTLFKPERDALIEVGGAQIFIQSSSNSIEAVLSNLDLKR